MPSHTAAAIAARKQIASPQLEPARSPPCRTIGAGGPELLPPLRAQLGGAVEGAAAPHQPTEHCPGVGDREPDSGRHDRRQAAELAPQRLPGGDLASGVEGEHGEARAGKERQVDEGKPGEAHVTP